MTPSWYDVLDVDAEADADEIRAAWKGAIAELDPSDRRFRLSNNAAEVLLDPDQRAAHDAVLAAEAASDQDDSTTEVSDPLLPTGTAATARSTTGRGDEKASAAYSGWAPRAWLLAGLAILLAVLVGVCAWQLGRPTDASVEAATRAAQSSAERASVAVLSYDYRDLDASEKAASSFMTPSFRRDYGQLFSLIEENADSVKPVVTAEVVASGIERVSASGDRVSVLVFLNRPTTNASTTTPKVFQDQVTMKMQRVDGDWLVDDMITSPTT